MDGKSSSPEFVVPAGATNNESMSGGGERAQAMPEAMPQPAQPMSAVPMVDPTAMLQSAQAAAIPVAPIPQIMPKMPTSTASDVDVIEKAWVDKAKAIVAATRNDPKLQSAELGKVKATYIKARFHKDIKTEGNAS